MEPEEGAAGAEAGKRVAWRCMLCGYVEEGYPDGLPADYRCPICGAGPDGNLSFKDLFQCAALVSDALYAGEYEAAAAHMPEVERTHELVIKGLAAWQARSRSGPLLGASH